MYYGNEQADYTGMRAAYGPWGGLMATGQVGGGYGDAQADYTGMRGAYGSWGGAMAMPGYQGSPYGGYPDQGLLSNVGSRIRPATYTPPTPVYVSPSGQYVQQTGMFKDIGNIVGWNENPRNVSAMEYRIMSASDLADRAGTGMAAGAFTAGGLLAGAAITPLGAMAGKFVGRGIGGLAGSLLGPMGTAVGAGVGSAAGGLIGGLGISMLPMMAASAMGDLLVDQMKIRSDLENSSFRFVGAGSSMADPRTGAGMNTKSRGKIAEYLTSLDVKDPFLDLGEMTRILSGASSMGLMNNTQNIDDFKKRFKDVADNVKNIARVFHTTLEDGLKVMRDFRGIGVADPNQVGRMVMSGESYGLVAGKTGTEMMQIGMQGAELLRGTGVSMTIGYQAAQMNLAAIRSARDAGVLEQEAVAQAGGEEALAQRMTASGVGYAQSRRGRASAASFWGGGDQFNALDFMKTVRGDVSVPDMAGQAASRLADPKELLKYQVNQEKYLSNVGKTFGGQGFQMMQMGEAMSSARFLQQQLPGLDTKTAFRSVLKLQMGLSEPEIETTMARIENANKEFQGSQKAAESLQAREMAESSYQNFFFTRLTSRAWDVTKGIMSEVTNPAGRMIDEAKEGLKTWTEQNAFGVFRGDVSNVNYKQGWLQETLQKPQGTTLSKTTVMPAGTKIPAGTKTSANSSYFKDVVLDKPTSFPEGTVFPQRPDFPEGVTAPEMSGPGEIVVPVKVDLPRTTTWSRKDGSWQRVDGDSPYADKTRARLESLPASDTARAVAGSVVDLRGGGFMGDTSGKLLLKRMESLQENLGMGVITDANAPQVMLKKQDYYNNRGVLKESRTVGLDYLEMRKQEKLLSRLALTKDERDKIESTDDYKSAEAKVLQNIKNIDLNAKGGYKDIVLAATGKTSLEDVTQEEMAAVFKYTENLKSGFFGKDQAGDKMAQIFEDQRALQGAMGQVDVKSVADARTRYDNLKSSVFTNMGIDKSLAKGITDESFDYLVRAQKETDPEKKKALLNEFVGRVSISSGVQVSEVGKGAEGALNYFGKELGGAYDDIRTLQIGRGREALKSKLESRMKLATKDDRAVWKEMIEAVDDPRKYQNFIQANKAFLNKDESLGKTLVSKSDDLLAIPTAVTDYAKASEAFEKAPTAANKKSLSDAEEVAKQKLKLINPFIDITTDVLKTYSKMSQSDIVDQINTVGVQLQTTDFAQDQVANTPGGGTTGTQTTTKGSPQEAFTTQVNINYAILQALSALNASLHK